MADNKKGSNRIMVVLITVVVISVIIAAIVIILYYVKGNKKIDNKFDNKMTFADISENRINLLLKHISLMDPAVSNRGLIQMKDLSDDLKITIVIEDLIDTDKFTRNDDSIIIKFDDILERALLIFNQKTYDYYPDNVDYYNYHFTKDDRKYIGTKNENDSGEYHYKDIEPNVVEDTLYLNAKIAYYEDKYGAYSDSEKSEMLCEGEHCIEKYDLSSRELRELHAMYKIVNNQFIFVSASVSEIVPE